MATNWSIYCVSDGLGGFSSKYSHRRLIVRAPRMLPASYKARQDNLRFRNKKQQLKKRSLKRSPYDKNLQSSGKENSASESASADNVPKFDQEIISNHDIDGRTVVKHAREEDLESQSELNDTKIVAANATPGEQISSFHLEDLISMIRNAEKNIILLYQARARALQDLERILIEKDTLHGGINVSDTSFSKSDAQSKIAAQENIVELVESELEMLQNKLTNRSQGEGGVFDEHDNQTRISNEESSFTGNKILRSLNEDLRSLRNENISLEEDIQALKLQLTTFKGTNERMAVLEKEHPFLESGLKDLELKLKESQEHVSSLSSLKFEYKDLSCKVENLQGLLHTATKQADQVGRIFQQNQDLRKKVNRLEESFDEINSYKLSSEKLQRYNDLMQQKMKILEGHLQSSDDEIHAYVHLYQNSVKEFEDTLNSLKEESKRRALDEPVEDMPWDFWSRLLLLIDGWLFEKKISHDDAKFLREMVWKRNRQIRDTYMACRNKNEGEAVDTFLTLTSSPKCSGLHIIHIAAEMAPVAKVGGLGDVVTGLGKALQKKGHLVEIVVPKYDCLQYECIDDLRPLDVVLESYFDCQLYKNKIWVGTVEGLPVYFIEPYHPDRFFWRGQFYGERDDFRRFSFFSRAALELLLQAGKKPDIIHCHDWQTAFIAPLYWDIYAPKGLNSARICFTCHNFEYQGTAGASEVASCGLDIYQMNRPDRMQDNSAHERVNSVKGGIVFSNIVTTVSPTYAQEVRTNEGGQGLHSTLNSHSKKFVGVLNGIDMDAWNPATDAFLKVQYSVNDLQGKAENKEALKKHLGLSSIADRQPLVGCITRLVPQKGVHLIRHAMYKTLELGGQFVLLGSSPVSHIQREFEGIANHFQNHDQIRLILKYDDSLSHAIYAASDMFIIPSIFEPCGLTQMIAMRYGSVPIVRRTGGLNDSVFDVDDDTIPLQFRNGYTFTTPDERGVNGALERAFNDYGRNAESWEKLVEKDMKIDFSWDSSAAQYEELYKKAVSRARDAGRA